VQCYGAVATRILCAGERIIAEGRMGAVHASKDLEEYLALSNAARLVYQHVSRSTCVLDTAQFNDILNDVAFAISNVAPIFVGDGAAQRCLTPMELLGCKFRHGATILAARNGKEYRDLKLRRGDMLQAAAVLRGAHVSFFRR
jgi:hypothetical protein